MSERWERDPEAIAAWLTTLTVADTPPPDPPPPPPTTQRALHRQVAAHIRATDEPNNANEAGDRVIETARGLARHNSEVILQQIQGGDDAERAARAVLNAIYRYLTADDHASAVASARRLIGLNPERETMAGMMTAAAGLLKTGVALKRQALAMDVIRPDDGVNAGPIEPVKGAGARLLERLPPDALMKLREIALSASRLSPAELGPMPTKAKH